MPSYPEIPKKAIPETINATTAERVVEIDEKGTPVPYSSSNIAHSCIRSGAKGF
jgi:hypothetical protein